MPIIGGNLACLEMTEELVSLDFDESSEYDRESVSFASSFAKPPILSAIIPLLSAYV